MIEDSIHVFIVKVEQYFLNFKRKRLRKKNPRLYCVLFTYASFGEENKRQKIALIYFALIDVFLPDVPFSAAHIG